MATAVKRHLSGSTNGLPIKITQTATAGDLIHTAVAGTTDGTYDEIWIYATNNHTAAVVLTIEFGNANTENNKICTIAFKAGEVLIIPGFILRNELTVKAFASVANVISLTGFVNRMTD